MAYVSVASVAVLLVGIGIGPMLCLSAYPSEVTTQVTRPNAMWMGGVSFWITGSVQMLVIPYSLSAWGGYAYFPFLLSVLFVVRTDILLFIYYNVVVVVPRKPCTKTFSCETGKMN